MDDLGHLTPGAAAVAHSSNAGRFAFIERDKIIETPTLTQVQGRLQELYSHHQIQRPPNLAIVGPSGIGKSHAIEDFVAKKPRRRSPSTGELQVPVLHVEYPPLPSAGWYAKTLAMGLGYAVAMPRQNADRFELILERLVIARTRLIVVEEVNQLHLWGGAYVAEFYGLTRWLSNQSKVPMVLSGTEEVLELIDGDIQLVRRFERLELKPWDCDGDFAGFVKAYIANLPLRKPTDLDRSLIERIYESGLGITDTTVKVLQRAAKRAILSGDEQLKLELVLPDATTSPPIAEGRKTVRRGRLPKWAGRR